MTLDANPDASLLKNPHVHRELKTLYEGHGVDCAKDEWAALQKKLGQRLQAELTELKNLIGASHGCKA
jgi:hypothetical protein